MLQNTITRSGLTLLKIERLKRIFHHHNFKKLHACCYCINANENRNNVKNLNLQTRQFSTTSPTYIWTPWSKSTPAALPAELPISSTVDPVTIDPGITEAVSSAIIDPSFVELGLASSWWPNHLVHQMLEFVHLSTDLPWWSTIIIGTLILRVVSFPLYLYTRKWTIKFNNASDETKKHQEKIDKYKMQGDVLQRQMAEHKLIMFQRKTGTGPIRGILVNSSMSVLFITCVTAVRQMCGVPVPSMTEGGALWFMDLASADPYYVLPLITGVIMSLTINTSIKGKTFVQGSWSGALPKIQFLPIILMPLVFGRMSSGIYLYWITTSVITLGIQRALLIPGFKEKLNFPIPKESEKGGKASSFREMWKEQRKKASEKAGKSVQLRTIKREIKQKEKDRKKELKGKPPITFEIGVDAMPTSNETPDFEREWRPARPKHFGTY